MFIVAVYYCCIVVGPLPSLPASSPISIGFLGNEGDAHSNAQLKVGSVAVAEGEDKEARVGHLKFMRILIASANLTS
jgi:hypothetical protein